MRNEPEHPDLETLFGYREGSLAEVERRSVEAHIRGCAACRLETERMRHFPNHPVEPPPVQDLLARLARKQRGWTEASGPALKRKVALELAPYVGLEAAEAILQEVADNGENLLSTVDAALRLFLGKAAASRLTSRIVDRAILSA